MNRRPTPAVAPSAARRRSAEPDPFRFGFRFVKGVSERVPLTPEDLLHPQEGDQITQNSAQDRDVHYLRNLFESRLVDQPDAVVLCDVLVNWGVRDLRNHSPDLVVFQGVADRDRVWRTFSVVAAGARPMLVIEIVSPDAHDPKVRNNDVVIKVQEYYRAGVPLYILVDQAVEGGPRRLIGYRRGARGYVQMRLDAQGRLLLKPVQLLLMLRANWVVGLDAATEEEIGNFPAMVKAREAAELDRAAAEAARQTAEAAREAEAQAHQAAAAALAAAQVRIRELEAQARGAGATRSRKPRG
jgi:colicin import membrane protein